MAYLLDSHELVNYWIICLNHWAHANQFSNPLISFRFGTSAPFAHADSLNRTLFEHAILGGIGRLWWDSWKWVGGAKINSPNGLQGVDNGSRHVAQAECVTLKQQVLKSDLLEWDSLTFGSLILSSYCRLINGLWPYRFIPGILFDSRLMATG